MLSNTCKYAIRAVTYLAFKSDKKDTKKRIGLKVISEELNIPTPFLGKILQNLAKNKLLVSSKGPHGGFRLAKSSDKISLYDIVIIIDGKDFFDNCIFGYEVCKNKKSKQKICPIHPKSGPIRNELKALFKGLTLAEVSESFENNGFSKVVF